MKYAFIRRHRQMWPIRIQCRVLGVSVTGYHEHFARRLQIAGRRHLSDEALIVHMRAVYEAQRGAYGWPRIWRQLRAQGLRVGMQRLMQQNGIRARGKRRFRVTTTDSRHSLPIAPNLLDRHFTAAAPNQVWTGDITYIPTDEGWLFLAVVIDLFSRRIVGWSLREDMRSESWSWRHCEWLAGNVRRKGLLLHSDRGSRYASSEFSQVLNRWSIRPSMSRKGNCWDNACSETVFASLKVERL